MRLSGEQVHPLWFFIVVATEEHPLLGEIAILDGQGHQAGPSFYLHLGRGQGLFSRPRLVFSGRSQ